MFSLQYHCCGSTFNKTENSWTEITDEYPIPIKGYRVPNSCCVKPSIPNADIEDCRKFPHKYNLTGESSL